MTAATLAPPRWTQRSSVPPAQRRDTEPNVRRPMADRANGTAAHRSVTATRLWPRSRYPISARTPPSPRPTAPHRRTASIAVTLSRVIFDFDLLLQTANCGVCAETFSAARRASFPPSHPT